ncbi:MAG: PAS domain-containing sensor histidine kinase [Actinomycetota bacterium]|nr:PAS domain-containing sensor histidine kinase [Actinomycetota bacterium]
MVTLGDRIRHTTDLPEPHVQHLRSLCSCWQLLADLSFSDLLLYVKVPDADVFEICAQLRPLTSQTLYPEDMVGRRYSQPEQPVVERAFREAEIWSQDEPVLIDGIPVQMDAVPVQVDDHVVGVVTKEGSPGISRRPGLLERVYLEAAERISQMIADGWFPFRHAPLGDWPRAGEGLFVLDGAGCIEWASPNALSSLHRLGIGHNATGRLLDELGFDGEPAAQAMRSLALVDGEIDRGDTSVRFRIVPLIENGKAVGAVALARDVTELRRKERVISVKDATIREIHHRVKNNLQTIASLLRLQGRRVGSPEARSALKESELRIGSIALVHETLSENPSDVADFGDIARRIAGMVSEGLILPEQEIDIKVTGSTGPLNADLATPLAVTLAELIQNCIEHAFPEGRSGTVRIELSMGEGDLVAVVWDDGVGISSEVSDAPRLGLQIVRSLIEELNGTFEMTSDSGTRVEVRVPLPNPGAWTS